MYSEGCADDDVCRWYGVLSALRTRSPGGAGESGSSGPLGGWFQWFKHMYSLVSHATAGILLDAVHCSPGFGARDLRWLGRAASVSRSTEGLQALE